MNHKMIPNQTGFGNGPSKIEHNLVIRMVITTSIVSLQFAISDLLNESPRIAKQLPGRGGISNFILKYTFKEIEMHRLVNFHGKAEASRYFS